MDKEKSPEQKKKFLFVSDEGLIGDLAWEVTKEGHEVLYYIKEKAQKDVCEGFVNKTDDWQEKKDWADVIIFDDVVFGQTAETLRKQGKLVFGGSVYADKLEMDREFGQEEMKSLGINILPNWNFSDFDAAIDFIQKNPGRYVVKPSGHAQGEKELSFVGQEEDGKDIIQVLEHYKKHWSKKIKEFQLQKFVSGVEIAVGAFFNGKEFVKPVFVNFEHKKMFPGNIGPSCYSEDTEILTDKGWKKFSEVNYEDKILSFNKDKEELVWEYPLKIFWMKYNGKMIHFKNRYIDLLLTPNHRTLNILKKDFYKKKIRYRVHEARELYNSGEFIIPQASTYKGLNPEFFELPEFKDGRRYTHTKKQIKIDAWAKFMGWYLSEGSYFKNGARIAQSRNSRHNKDIIDCLKNLPFNFCQLKDGFKINSTQLSGYLKQFGHVHEKYVPEHLKNGSEMIIRSFLDEFNKGDGDVHAGQKRYHSSSYKLISDIQEMLVKINISSTITKDKRTKSLFPNEKTYDHTPVFSLEERKNNYSSIRKKDKKETEYNGHIGCVKVHSTFVVVRRNGRVAISGNTGEMGTLGFWNDSSIIFEATAAKFKEKLAQSGYVGYFDVNCIVNSKGIYPLEMTCFSEDTEILTKNEGWKLIKDVRLGETVATLNPKTHKLEYQDVINTISKKHAGHMINICGAGKNHEAINCLVTPDHQMYIEKRNGQFDFVRADEIPQGSKIKRDCKWNGKNLKNYIVPEYIENHYLGKHKKIHKIKHSKVVMPVKCWLKFLGIFLAEGSIGGKGHHVCISQYSKKKEVKELLRDFPFKVSENKNGFQISSTQLVKHLLSFGFGKANTKYVPEYVKSLPPEQIKIFLDSFRIGDGNIHKRTKQVSYFSTSKKLIDDIQELLLKCGIVGNIRKINAKGTKMKDYKYFRNHDLYWISERTKKTNFYVDKRNIKKSFYKGKVHCVEVSNHIIYVRRQGKPFWCGNCRFGYPTISLQIEGINSKWGDILYNLAKGEPFNINTKKGFQLCVVVAVPPFPFTDPASFKKYSEEAVVLFKKPINQGIHLGDVKFVENDWRLAGYSGYALVITDSATTVEDARKQVYNKIANIMIPNMFYRTDIGLGWPTDSDKLLTWGYLH